MYRRICRAAALAAVALLTALPGAAQAKGVTATDRAFVREMVPHHEMAIEMAEMARMQATHSGSRRWPRASSRTRTPRSAG
jgi:uncharacterized protein (DUF305 family)